MVEQSLHSGAHSVSDSGDQGGSDVSSGGETTNFRELFERTNSELSQTREQTSRLQREFSQAQKKNQEYGQTIDRLKQALTGEDGDAQQVSPAEQMVQSLEGEMDQYIQAAIDAERQGKPIPLTSLKARSSARAIRQR
jgi:predicted RNase H-like nuclease (RuvC/YqgF family)